VRTKLLWLVILVAAAAQSVPGGEIPAAEPEQNAAQGADQSAAPEKKAEHKQSSSSWDKDPDAWRFAIYPLYVFGPLVRTVMSFPSLPSGPGAGIGSGGFTANLTGGINGVLAARYEIQKKKWLLEGNGYWGSLYLDHLPSSPW
jgi:hypothetical protein